MGHKEGLSLMEESDPLLLLIGLPTIPVGLVLAKMTRWEDYILHLYRTYWQVMNSAVRRYMLVE